MDMTRSEVIRKIGLKNFIKSRIVSPAQIVRVWRRESAYHKWSLGEIIFFTMYETGKAIKGYDYLE